MAFSTRNLNWVSDVGAPVAVTAVHLLATKSTSMFGNFTMSDVACYGMAAGGYLAALFGWGGNFAKNVGIAAAPLAIEKLYAKMSGSASTIARPVAMRRVARYPAPAEQAPFQGVKLV